MRTPFVAGNWKMNLERRSALDLVAALRERVGQRRDVDVAVFPPFVYLAEIARALAGSPVKVGAQNCCAETGGAFTGEIAVGQILDCGATSVILGHSERRHVYGETDALIARKVKTALEAGLDVILCVGEKLEEREAKATEKVIGAQLRAGLDGVDARAMRKITIAYEPVWAIGTGRNATSQQASEAHAYLRGVLAGLYTDPLADTVRIQYGGSVKPSNIRELMAAPDVDGCLVGGASLQADSFLPLLEFR
ncbi:MAG: triose-phosphate isomerase [Planctomycetota bacterium]